MNGCEKWLNDFLKQYDIVLCDTVRDGANKMGFTRKQLKEARKALGVKTTHLINGDSENWFWYLPKEG